MWSFHVISAGMVVTTLQTRCCHAAVKYVLFSHVSMSGPVSQDNMKIFGLFDSGDQ